MLGSAESEHLRLTDHENSFEEFNLHVCDHDTSASRTDGQTTCRSNMRKKWNVRVVWAFPIDVNSRRVNYGEMKGKMANSLRRCLDTDVVYNRHSDLGTRLGKQRIG